MKLLYNWSGSVFTAETPEEKAVLDNLVDILIESGITVTPPQVSSKHVPEYDRDLGELWIPGE